MWRKEALCLRKSTFFENKPQASIGLFQKYVNSSLALSCILLPWIALFSDLAHCAASYVHSISIDKKRRPWKSVHKLNGIFSPITLNRFALAKVQKWGEFRLYNLLFVLFFLRFLSRQFGQSARFPNWNVFVLSCLKKDMYFNKTEDC